MLRVNDYVNYSTHGICKVEAVAEMKLGSKIEKREYYILSPVFRQDSKLYVPTDNQTLLQRMRPLLSEQEIDQIILSAKDQSMSWIADHKERKLRFGEIFSRRDERELLLLISCLYLQSQNSKKGLTAYDAQILKKAESVIEQEFAFSLHISPKNVRNYIQKKLGIVSEPKLTE